ncbi:hypothetical protein Tco_0730759 [Tanacetum coccineum]
MIPEPHSRIEKGIKNHIEPIAPTMAVNKLVPEWEKKIKLHQDKEMKFDQWRKKIFNNERPASMKEECKVKDEGEVTQGRVTSSLAKRHKNKQKRFLVIFDEKRLESSYEVSYDDSWRTI